SKCEVVESAGMSLYARGGGQPCDTGVMDIDGAKLSVECATCLRWDDPALRLNH
ncbi:hypothetical protein SMMN14_04274, partial [Sphaerulina musiva]